MNKKGFSTVVFYLIIIVVILLFVGAVWAVIKNVTSFNYEIIEKNCHYETYNETTWEGIIESNSNLSSNGYSTLISLDNVSGGGVYDCSINRSTLLYLMDSSKDLNDLKNKINFDKNKVYLGKENDSIFNDNWCPAFIKVTYRINPQQICESKNVTEITLEKNGIREVRSIDKKSPYKYLDKEWLEGKIRSEECECDNLYYSDISNQNIDCSDTECSSDIGNSPDYHCLRYSCGNYTVRSLK